LRKSVSNPLNLTSRPYFYEPLHWYT